MPAGPPVPVAPGTASSSVPPPPARRALGRRRVLAIAVAAILLAAALLGAYVLLRPSAGPMPPTFAEARVEANRTLANVSGGDWTLLSATGLDQRGASTIPVGEFATSANAGCTLGAVGGGTIPASLPVPAFSGSFAAGRAPFWLFLFRQSAAGPYLLADVVAGAAGPLAYLEGSGCVTNLSAISPLAKDTVDSPVVAGNAWSASDVDASAFVAGDPSIDTLAMLATGGYKVGTMTFEGWALEYAPCSPFVSGPLTNETTYDVLYDSTGTLLLPFTYHVGCPSA